MHEVKRWTLPRDYMGASWDDWFGSGFGRSRDSDILEESNFQTAYQTLKQTAKELPDHEIDKNGRDGMTVQIVREGHWAVGWVEWIAIHESDAETLDVARGLCERANDYPILDEDDFSSREWEAACSYWESMSVRDRVDVIQRYGKPYVSVFAARRPELPHNDNGNIFSYLTQ